MPLCIKSNLPALTSSAWLFIPCLRASAAQVDDVGVRIDQGLDQRFGAGSSRIRLFGPRREISDAIRSSHLFKKLHIDILMGNNTYKYWNIIAHERQNELSLRLPLADVLYCGVAE